MIGLASPLVRWVALIAAAIAFVAAVYNLGQSHARKAAAVEQLRAQLEAVRARRSVDDETRRLSDRDLCLRLGGVPDVCGHL